MLYFMTLFICFLHSACPQNRPVAGASHAPLWAAPNEHRRAGLLEPSAVHPCYGAKRATEKQEAIGTAPFLYGHRFGAETPRFLPCLSM